MNKTYCGKNCFYCPEHENGRCTGCYPDNATVSSEAHRYSEYCKIAICCKSKNFESCADCNARMTCTDYSKKGIMHSIIQSKLDVWGVTDHGLKESIKYQWILIFCYFLLLIPDVLSKFDTNVPYVLVYIPVSLLSIYGYVKMVPYSHIFRVTVLFTAGSILIRFLVDIIDYGFLVNGVLSAGNAVISLLNYKITLDAYADMVSQVDVTLEKSWLRVWPVTIILYAAAVIIALAKGYLFLMAIPAVLLDILIISLMLRTISVCRKN
jgi:hypothetical protein